MSQLDADYDLAVVLDADNLMAPDFLKKINAGFEKDHVAIQGHRTAKNLDTSLAVLDAISEEINNHIFRKGHRVLGLSSALIGSAMAFHTDIYRRYIPQLTAVGGFDKELELKLLRDGIFISYLDNAFVLDEKVQSSKIFYSQRKRWMTAQIIYFGRDFFPSVLALFRNGNINYFDKTLQFSSLPRVLLLGLLGLIAGINLFIYNPVFNWLWFGAFIACALSILISIPNHFYRKETFRALLYLPLAFVLMLSLLFRLRKSDKHFIHTNHDIQTP